MKDLVKIHMNSALKCDYALKSRGCIVAVIPIEIFVGSKEEFVG